MKAHGSVQDPPQCYTRTASINKTSLHASIHVQLHNYFINIPFRFLHEPLLFALFSTIIMHVLYEACDMIPEFHVPLAPCTWLHPKTILLLRKKFEN